MSLGTHNLLEIAKIGHPSTSAIAQQSQCHCLMGFEQTSIGPTDCTDSRAPGFVPGCAVPQRSEHLIHPLHPPWGGGGARQRLLTACPKPLPAHYRDVRV